MGHEFTFRVALMSLRYMLVPRTVRKRLGTLGSVSSEQPRRIQVPGGARTRRRRASHADVQTSHQRAPRPSALLVVCEPLSDGSRETAGGWVAMMSDLSPQISGEEEDTDLSEAAVRRAFPRYDIGRILSKWYAADIYAATPVKPVGPAGTLESLVSMICKREAEVRR